MNNWKSRLAPAVIAISFLSGCASGGAATHKVPPATCPDDKVAAELETIPFEGYEDLWGWLDSIYVLLDQIAVAR